MKEVNLGNDMIKLFSPYKVYDKMTGLFHSEVICKVKNRKNYVDGAEIINKNQEEIVQNNETISKPTTRRTRKTAPKTEVVENKEETTVNNVEIPEIVENTKEEENISSEAPVVEETNEENVVENENSNDATETETVTEDEIDSDEDDENLEGKNPVFVPNVGIVYQ